MRHSCAHEIVNLQTWPSNLAITHLNSCWQLAATNKVEAAEQQAQAEHAARREAAAAARAAAAAAREAATAATAAAAAREEPLSQPGEVSCPRLRRDTSYCCHPLTVVPCLRLESGLAHRTRHGRSSGHECGRRPQITACGGWDAAGSGWQLNLLKSRVHWITHTQSFSCDSRMSRVSRVLLRAAAGPKGRRRAAPQECRPAFWAPFRALLWLWQSSCPPHTRRGCGAGGGALGSRLKQFWHWDRNPGRCRHPPRYRRAAAVIRPAGHAGRDLKRQWTVKERR